MRWLELTVEADVEAVEAVSEILGRVANGTAVHPTRLIRDPDDELSARADPDGGFVVTAHLADGPDAAAAIDATERALWHLRAFDLRPLGALGVRRVDDAEWSDAWKAHYVPQRIGRVVIRPSWSPAEDPDPADAVIVLDPGMAFGTGLHPTTRGCLELLQDVSPMPAEILDVGCGSGVLALAALKLGAEHAVALDTDPLAVDSTRENATRNGLADAIEVRQGSLDEHGGPYELILANLVAAVLIDLAPRLAAHLGTAGILLASGIIEPRAPEVIDAMRAAGLRVAARRDDGEWVSLRLEHAS